MEELTANKLCKKYGLNFANTYKYQFCLSKYKKNSCGGFLEKSIGDWIIFHSPFLKVSDAISDDGSLQCVFLGIGVDQNAEVITDEILQKALSKKNRSHQEIIDGLLMCAGRYAFIVSTNTHTRLFLDPVGSLGVVYNAQTQSVASTLHLCLDREVIPNEIYPFSADAISNDARFAFQHTRDGEVRRLIPNHFLDLESFQITRHWPVASDIYDVGSEEFQSVIQRICHRLQAVVGAITVENSPILFPLSGGTDSRVLLAATLKHIHQVDTIFSHAESRASRLDTEIAKKIATEIKQKIQIIDPQKNASQRVTDDTAYSFEKYKFSAATGGDMEVTSFTRIRLEVASALPEGGVVLRANVLDFMKAVLWRKAVVEYTENQTHAIQNGIKMMMITDGRRAKSNPKIRRYYRNWFNSLPKTAQMRPYDFMFSEQFLSHGMGNEFYGYNRNFYLCPFNDRMLIGLATSLPPDDRAQFLFTDMMLEEMAPNLLKFEYTRQRDNEIRARRRAKVTK